MEWENQEFLDTYINWVKKLGDNGEQKKEKSSFLSGNGKNPLVKTGVVKMTDEEKKKPQEKLWFGLGENYGISVAVWENNITLTKRKKEGEQWVDGEKFNVSPAFLERFYIHLPNLFEKIKKKESEK